eukprot:TRINITY_DN2834_c0_g1_i6.p2 TRINITY_DN2834_c0_g1~~TRINITY_DN2834_c0_g1_i6.p2  ORF type:complete len:109 (+),score=12.82 TRINITY_DN2834_c0_g1_i6:48-374(+)
MKPLMQLCTVRVVNLWQRRRTMHPNTRHQATVMRGSMQHWHMRLSTPWHMPQLRSPSMQGTKHLSTIRRQNTEHITPKVARNLRLVRNKPSLSLRLQHTTMRLTDTKG